MPSLLATSSRRLAPAALRTALAGVLLLPASRLPAQEPAVSVIPYPASVRVDPAVRYRFGATPTIALSAPGNDELRALGEIASGILRDELGARARVATGPASAAGAALALVLAPRDSAAGDESYRLDVSARGVTIAAPRPAGLFYGLQTLRALLEDGRGPGDTTVAATRARRVALRGVHIADAPRFGYRGLHLDVGRHFAPVSFVKQFIDVMARYKYNTFHWHLTEDQGWRIEIKRYPKLTEVGSCRKETQLGFSRQPYVGDSIRYCGFYTQDEIRDVVAYAKARHITIVPEIEMPGHAKAAIASYPELACTPGPFEVRTTWGIDDEIYCPTEATFQFVENVLTEVIALFPGPFVHVGGDEAPKVRWRASPAAQAVIKRENLKDEEELQSYFIRRVERFLNAHGKRLIGWDEILEGGIAPQATVMSWRGIAGGIAAARQGHDVVMAPNTSTYFDYVQGDRRFEPFPVGRYLPLDSVYAYDPVPDSLTADEARHVLGAQGQHWTEYMATTDRIWYMAYPRALALAEVVWTPKADKSWDSFRRRLLPRLYALDRLGVTYRFPGIFAGLESNRVVQGNTLTLELQSTVPEAQIRYTLDGSQPDAHSPRYTGPLRLQLGPDGVSVVARAFLDANHVSPPRAATFRPAQ
jgi:hexosaminidase